MKTRQSAVGEVAKKTKALLKQQAVLAKTIQEPATDSNGLQDRIATQAYALYEARGYRHGGDLQDWLDAEREILSQQQPT